MAEFLPLCDVLFNVISLAGYFCNIVFDVVLGYAYYERGHISLFVFVICLVTTSLITSQILSYRWYSNRARAPNSLTNSLDKPKQKQPSIIAQSEVSVSSSERMANHSVIVVHLCQMGVLWRYAKLFLPVDLRLVKQEIRDLCMLRLVHAFLEAAPMLLLQTHTLVTIHSESQKLDQMQFNQILGGSTTAKPEGTIILQQSDLLAASQQKTFKDLNVVSAMLSLFSVCWALASFSKNVRLQNMHRLVLTWLGVIFQFMWRLGTIISRVISLTMYASVYSYWVFLVIVLHWISMLLWLISPKNVFHGERISKVRKFTLATLISFIYIFEYVNLQEVNHRQKMMTYYIVMFCENMLLVCLFLVGVWQEPPVQWPLILLTTIASFLLGLGFMILYYRFFHVRRLNYDAGGRPTGDYLPRTHNFHAGGFSNNFNNKAYQSTIPGVFNCRFSNPVTNATKRKKKKPTTFIPPPSMRFDPNSNSNTTLPPTASTPMMAHMEYENGSVPIDVLHRGPMAVPFWRRPLPGRSQTGGSSENEGSAGSRVNIHQKLQEKKQKQLAELKIIEEEIKQGKLGGPNVNNLGHLGEDNRQPIPRAKKHIELQTNCIWGDGSDKFNENTFAETRNISPISSQLSDNNPMGRARAPAGHLQSSANAVATSPAAPGAPCCGNYLNLCEMDFCSKVQQTHPYNLIPPPRNKLMESRMMPSMPLTYTNIFVNNSKQALMQRAKTPEILLQPHYLEDTQLCYDWINNRIQQQQQLPQKTDLSLHHNVMMSNGCHTDNTLDAVDVQRIILDSRANQNRVPSDIDSQVSLPRSYTLPREFKYHKRYRARRTIKNEHFVTSTNSSDGDVDSGDDNEMNPSSTHSNNSQRRGAHKFTNHAAVATMEPDIYDDLDIRSNLKQSNHYASSPADEAFDDLQRHKNEYVLDLTHNKALNNLDLLSNGAGSVINGRPQRERARCYTGLVRHETKL